MKCARCKKSSDRLVSCYWDRSIAICPPCCQAFADLCDSDEGQWPPVPGGVPSDLSELTP